MSVGTQTNKPGEYYSRSDWRYLVLTVADCRRGLPEEAPVQVPDLPQDVRWWSLSRSPQIRGGRLQMQAMYAEMENAGRYFWRLNVPDEFRSKVACENERIQLKCNPNSRVAVYSASYGRTEYESIQCPQPQGVPEESECSLNV